MNNELSRGMILHERYKIREVIGRGGFSIVYRAWDLLVFRYVAIKEFFHSDCAKRDIDESKEVEWRQDDISEKRKEISILAFRREAAIMQALGNVPYVTRIYEYFTENSTEYIVMNLLRGKSLLEYSQEKGGHLQAAELIPMMEKAIFAVEKMHEAGYLHRDICPGNLILTEEGEICLIDFGAATSMDEKSACYSENIFGHKGFQAPEYARLQAQGPWTDIYSLCATIVAVLTGNPMADSEERRMYDPIPQEITRCKLSGQQQSALLKGLDIDPDQRLASAYELRISLCREMYLMPDHLKAFYVARSDRGSRDKNQDNLLIDGDYCRDGRDFQAHGEIICEADEIHMVAVCDGVGGSVEGEIAAMAGVQALSHFLERNEKSDILPERLLDDMLDELNEKVVSLQKKIGRTAATVSIFMWKGKHFYAANIGDSPIFRLHKKKLVRISRPHTIAEEKIKRGEPITLKDRRTLSAYLGKSGIAGSQMRSLVRGHIAPGDVFCICTDGVANGMNEEKLKSYMSRSEEKCLSSMWKVLQKNKERDNCTAIVLRFS